MEKPVHEELCGLWGWIQNQFKEQWKSITQYFYSKDWCDLIYIPEKPLWLLWSKFTSFCRVHVTIVKIKYSDILDYGCGMGWRKMDRLKFQKCFLMDWMWLIWKREFGEYSIGLKNGWCNWMMVREQNTPEFLEDYQVFHFQHINFEVAI